MVLHLSTLSSIYMSIILKPCQTQLNRKHPSKRGKGGKKERTIIQPKDNTLKNANAPMKGIRKRGTHQRIPPFVFDPPKIVKITT
jgi:hypothetical protein